MEFHDDLVAQFPKPFLELLTIPGVGPKTATRLIEKLGIRSIAGVAPSGSRPQAASRVLDRPRAGAATWAGSRVATSARRLISSLAEPITTSGISFDSLLFDTGSRHGREPD